jgi:uncharacterized protein YggU (UPF0235/DUF167 family)
MRLQASRENERPLRRRFLLAPPGCTIKLRAPAVEVKANTALLRFLAEKLSIPRNAIVLERGERSRDKVIRVDDLS